MHHRWKSRATWLALGLLATTVAVASPRSAVPVDARLLTVPLTAPAFTDTMLTRNASLEAMRQAVVAAVARVSPAGSLDDPMLSVSAAPRTFGATHRGQRRCRREPGLAMEGNARCAPTGRSCQGGGDKPGSRWPATRSRTGCTSIVRSISMLQISRCLVNWATLPASAAR